MYVRTMFALVSVTTLMLLSGCQKEVGPQPREGDTGELEELVLGTGAKWQTKTDFDGLFADGATLSDKERTSFSGLFMRSENVKIDGDTATIEVLLGEDIKDDYVERTVTWEAKKEGGTWKLTTAPLQ